jgi:hypothetical protein
MIEDEGKFYLYRHIRLDTNEVFYVGIGSKPLDAKSHEYIYTRAYNQTQRSEFWKRIVDKTEYRVEIILESDDKEFIGNKEKEFIRLYGRRCNNEGTLANICTGGIKDWKYTHSSIAKIKMSETRKGRKRPIEVCEKIRKTLTGKPREDLLVYYDIYDLEGILVYKEKTVKELSTLLGVCYSTIRYATIKKYKLLKKYYSVVSGSSFELTNHITKYRETHPTVCTSKDCDKKTYALGYCIYHYYHEAEGVKERIQTNVKKRKS